MCVTVIVNITKNVTYDGKYKIIYKYDYANIYYFV